MPSSATDRLASVVLAVEALGLAAVTGWEIIALAGGDTADATSAIALIVLTAVCAVAVGAFSVATARGRSWGRSGGIVTQLLMLAVALGALTGPVPSPGFAATVAIPAVVGLVLLFTAVRRAGSSRR